MNQLQISGQTPAAFFESYLRRNVNDGAAADRTVKAYKEGLCLFLSWCQTNSMHPLSCVRSDVEDYRLYLQEKYARSTSRLRLLAVHLLFRALVAEGLRVDNPAEGVRAARDRTAPEDRVIQKALTPDEACRFVKVIPAGYTRRGARDRAMIFSMLYCGLRAEEVCRLTWAKVGADYIDVNGKGNKLRRVQLPNAIREAFENLRSLQPATASQHEPVFSIVGARERVHSVLNVRTIERITDRYLIRADLKKRGRSCHSLRHTFALLCVLTGAKREALRDAMGHSNLATTDIYTSIAGRYQQNPAAGLDAALNQEND